MNYLTRKEEMILLTILKLKGQAGLVQIRKELIALTGEEWTVGNVYVPLDRMSKHGYLSVYIGKPTSRRGGKAVKYYRLTSEAKKALAQCKKVHETVWAGVRDSALEE